MLIFVFLPILVLYFRSKGLKSPLTRKGTAILAGYSTLFGAVLLLVEAISNEMSWLDVYLLKQSSEFLWISVFIVILYLFFQSFVWSLVLSNELIIPSTMTQENLVKVLLATNHRMGVKNYRTTTASGAEYFLPGSFGLRFDQFLLTIQEPVSGVKVVLTNSRRNLRVLALFQFLLILPLILVRANQIPPIPDSMVTTTEILNLSITFFSSPINIDVVSYFVVGLILFVLLGITLVAMSENLLLTYEDTFKKAKVDQVFSLPALGMQKPQADLQSLKEKAQEQKDSARRKLEEEKRKRVEGVMGILSPEKTTEVQQMDSEVLRLEALIFTVRTVLQATPSHRVIPLTELHNYFNKKFTTTEDDLESIVFGLIQRKEVEGVYNIWDRVYYGGSTARRFVDKTLDHADDLQGNLRAVKVKADGSVEFYFHTEPPEGSPNEEEENELTKQNNAPTSGLS